MKTKLAASNASKITNERAGNPIAFNLGLVFFLVTCLATAGLAPSAKALDPNTDSVESATISKIPGNPSYVGGSTITLALSATFESGGNLTVNSTSGVTWMASGNGTLNGDTYTTPSVNGGTTITITGVYYSERFDFWDDKVKATMDISVVPNRQTAAPPPLVPAFGAPPGGYQVASVSLQNPFSQNLAIDSESLATPGAGTSGQTDTLVFDPFANQLNQGRFSIAAGQTINTELGFQFASGNTSDQDALLYLSGTLDDGTRVSFTSPEMDFTQGTTPSINGSFAAIPEPSIYAAILGVTTLGFVMFRRRATQVFKA